MPLSQHFPNHPENSPVCTCIVVSGEEGRDSESEEREKESKESQRVDEFSETVIDSLFIF